jgi:GT2 family glycosyltransferase
VVVLNWNQPAMTARCLDHVRGLRGVPADVVVIDNGSTAENRTALLRLCGPDAPVLRLAHNRGFAGGMNAGIRHAVRRGYEFVWLLNNDAFPKPDCLAALVRAMDADRRLAAVTPKLLNADGSEQIAGAMLDWATGRQRYLSAAELPPTDTPGVSVIGTAILLRVAALTGGDGFDPRFFAYREEDDLCFRLVRRAGRLAAVSAAECYHLERGSTGGRVSPLVQHLYTRNGWLLLRKHLPAGRWPAAWCRYAAGCLADLGRVDRFQGRGCAHALLGGLWHATTGRSGKPGRLRAPWLVEYAVSSRAPAAARLLERAAGAIERVTGRLHAPTCSTSDSPHRAT